MIVVVIVFAVFWVGIPLVDTIRHFEAYRNFERFGLLDPRVWRL